MALEQQIGALQEQAAAALERAEYAEAQAEVRVNEVKVELAAAPTARQGKSEGSVRGEWGEGAERAAELERADDDESSSYMHAAELEERVSELEERLVAVQEQADAALARAKYAEAQAEVKLDKEQEKRVELKVS